jgi:hypothetical protein
MSLKDLLTRNVEAGLRGGPVGQDVRRIRPLPPVAIRLDPSLPPTLALSNRELSELQDRDDAMRQGLGGDPASPTP